jgi:hypothetical protein
VVKAGADFYKGESFAAARDSKAIWHQTKRSRTERRKSSICIYFIYRFFIGRAGPFISQLSSLLKAWIFQRHAKDIYGVRRP